MRRPLALVFLLSLLAPQGALAGGFAPTTLPPLDPDAAAHFVIREEAAGEGLRHFADGGRFGGDLDGDGRDDIVLQAGADAELEIWFGDATWGAEGQDDDNHSGDTTLRLPDDCVGDDDRIRYAGLGDVDGDGYDDLGVACFEEGTGELHLYYGRPQPWGGSVADPDVIIGEQDGGRPGLRVAGLGDLDGDGFSDFAVTGALTASGAVPVAWIFHGAADASTALTELSEATWRVSGHDTLRCLEPLDVTSFGDVDGDDLSDFALGCTHQPVNPLDPSQDNVLDIALSAFLGASLEAAPAGDLAFEDRDFAWAAGVQRVPLAIPHAAVGDVDGDGFGDVGITAWFDLKGSLSAQVLAGSAEPSDIELISDYTPFQPGENYLDPEGVQLAPAPAVPGGDPGVWLRYGVGEAAQIGLLRELDPSTWQEFAVPPVEVVFTTPGGIDLSLDWRLGLGGPGDADGDGVSDLLILGGFADDDGCSPVACGGAWLVLCGDLDDDGVSACAGDCDDADPAISPAITEQCDDIDHDCDGDDGLADQDGDGVLGCEGDCDDNDPTVSPLADETCDAATDLDCDGLGPQDDADEDGTINCDDCQPWNPAMNPDLPEVCDGLDNDCDGQLPLDEQDIDADGWRGCVEGLLEADCDDLNPWIHPKRFEDCSNGIDDNCIDGIDEDGDADGDGVSTCDGDCDDHNLLVFPGAEELCDGLDNNCNDVRDDNRDFDGDGAYPCGGDCNNHDATVRPGAVGVCEPGLDSNCDGLDDLFDADGDGFTACSGDCDDTDPGISPQGQDYCDRLDNDCDGWNDDEFDLDTDGWATCHGECADGDSLRFPQPVEPVCDDMLDGDCDRVPDELDDDCPIIDPGPDFGPRPYGLACADCTGSVAGVGASGLAISLPLLLLLRRRRRRGRAGPSAALLALPAALLFLPTTGQAARTEPGLVVYLAPQPDLTNMVDARDLASDSGVGPEETVHTSELFEDGFDRDELLVWEARDIRLCETDEAVPGLGSSVDRALDALIQLDYRAATEVLDAAIAGLPCLQTPLPRRVLQNLFYYRGVAHKGSGDPLAADEDFQLALAIQPDYPGDPNFPPEMGEALEAQRATVAAQAEVPLLAYAPGNTKVRVDGVTWDARDGALGVRPGLHVVQYQRGSVLWTAVVTIAADTAPVAIFTGDRERALKDCVLDPAARQWVASALGLAAADVGVDIVALVDLEGIDESVRWLYRPSRNAFSFEPEFLEKRRGGGRVATGGGGRGGRGGGGRGGGTSGGGRSGGGTSGGGTTGGGTTGGGTTGGGGRTGGGTTGGGRTGGGTTGGGRTGGAVVTVGGDVPDRVRVRVSGGFTYVHPFPYAQIPIDLGIRLVAGLFIDFEVAVGIAGPWAGGAVLLPSAGGGLSYRFDVGVFQPRIGAVGRVALDDSPSDGETIGVKGGWGGLLGFDVVPDGNFLFGLDAQGGMLGRYGWASINAGVGVRF